MAPLAETTELYEAIRDERLGPGACGRGSGRRRDRCDARSAPAEPPVLLPMLGRRRELAHSAMRYRSSSPDGRVASSPARRGSASPASSDALVAAAAGRRGHRPRRARVPGRGVDRLRADRRAAARRVRLGSWCARPSRRRAAPTTLAEVERLVPLPGRRGRRESPRRRPGDSPAARARLLDAIATVLAALVVGPVPGLIAVEDLQWADDASREALLYLARRLEAGRCSWSSRGVPRTWRPGPRRSPSDGRGTSGRDDGRGSSGLDDVVVGALVDAAAAAGMPAWDAAALAAESEGLPLYVVEALVGGSGGRPPRAAAWRACAPARASRERERDRGPGAGGRRPSSAARSTSPPSAARAAAPTRRRSRPSRSSSGGGSSARSPAPASRHSTSVTRDSATRRTRRSGSRDAGCCTGAWRRCFARSRPAGTIRAAWPRSQATSWRPAGTRRRPRRIREAGLRARTVFANREALEHLVDGAGARPPGHRRDSRSRSARCGRCWGTTRVRSAALEAAAARRDGRRAAGDRAAAGARARTARRRGRPPPATWTRRIGRRAATTDGG